MPSVRLRGERQKVVDAQQFEAESRYQAVRDALFDSRANEKYYVEWKGLKEVAVLDVDWHGKNPPSIEERTFLMQSVEPQPSLWWVSKTGGLHLVYREKDDIYASTFAAIAALHFLERSNCSGVELIPRTRGTEQTNLVEHIQTQGVHVLESWLKRGGADPESIQRYLSERGWDVGMRLPHTECVIDARPNHKDGNPVQINDKGIYCYVCAANGDGFRSYGSLVGATSVNKLHEMAEDFVPWSNVRHYMKNIWGKRASEDVLKTLYRGCLGVVNGFDHPVVNKTFKDYSYLWGEGGIWLNENTYEATNLNKSTVIFSKLSSVLESHQNEEGVWVTPYVNENKKTKHFTSGQKPDSYPVHQVVHGSKIWGVHQKEDGDLVQIVKHHSDPPVQYRKDAIPVGEAWNILERYFPGANRNYLLLLMAMRGYGESGQGSIPMILVTGPSGSGKSGLPRLAAEILDDRVVPATYMGTHKEDLPEILGSGFLDKYGWLCIDEFGKNLKGIAAANAFTPFLTTDRHFPFRMLYKGRTILMVRTALILTNTEYPSSVYEDGQIGRRFVRVNLTTKVPDWEKTAGSFAGWRTRNQDTLDASNALYKHVVDRWFSGEPKTFKEVAAELGFITQLEEREQSDGVSTTSLLEDMFYAVCEGEEIHSSHWRGKGWKHGESPNMGSIGRAWEELHDEDSVATSRRVSETDLQAALGLTEPARLEISQHGKRIAFRFCSSNRNPRSRKFKVNEELLPTGHEPGPSGGNDTYEVLEEALSPESVDLPELDLPELETKSLKTHEVQGATKYMFMDLETRSTVNLKTAGSKTYAESSETDILCGSFIEVDENWTPIHVWMWDPFNVKRNDKGLWMKSTPFEQIPMTMGLPDVRDRILIAHNAFGFDKIVWEHHMDVQPAGWLDSLPLARVKALPGKLDRIGELLFDQGKDSAGSRMMMQMCQELKTGGFIEPIDQNMTLLMRYCLLDTLILAHAWRKERLDKLIEGFEGKVMVADGAINERGVQFDVDMAQRIIDLSQELIDEETSRVCKQTVEAYGEDKALQQEDFRRTAHLLSWLKDKGLSLPNLQTKTIKGWLSNMDNEEDGEDEYTEEAESIHPVLCDVLRARLGATRITTGKLRAAINAVDGDGRMRGLFHYYAAHTGRWGGRKFQPQNLPRGVKGFDVLEHIEELLEGVFPEGYDPHELLGSLIRLCVIPKPGKQFAILDYSKIELCGLAWAADDHEALENLGKGVDPYKVMSAELFRVDYNDVSKDQRQVGKTIELACVAEGTLVFTDRGWVPIEDITVDMRVWDGVEFVKHEGLEFRGDKEVVERYGTWFTPDHEILTEDGTWVEASELQSHRVLDNFMADGRLLTLPLDEEGVSRDYDYVVQTAVLSIRRTMMDGLTFERNDLRDATDAQSRKQAIRKIARLSRRCLKQSIARCGLIDYLRQKADAQTQIANNTGTMVGGELLCSEDGWKAQQNFCDIYAQLMVGIGRIWNSIVLTMIGHMNPETYESCLDTISSAILEEIDGWSMEEKDSALKISGRNIARDIKDQLRYTVNFEKERRQLKSSKTRNTVKAPIILPTYDIKNCGPRHRFQADSLIVHNCGYGLGSKGFSKYAASAGIDLNDVGLTPEDCINAYRDAHPTIAGERITEPWALALPNVCRRGGLWKQMEKDAIAAVQGCSTDIWRMEGNHLICTLPSGRQIVYRDARIEMRTPSYAINPDIPEDQQKQKPTLVYTHPRYKDISTYGGKLTENYIQALCRDMLAEALVRLEEAGFETVMHVHDEVVVEIDTPDQIDAVAEVLVQRPEWAERFPIAAEGFVAPRYVKAPPEGVDERKWTAKT